MKKLIITNLYKPFNRGGAERVVEQQIEREIAQGNEVVVCTARPWSVSGLIPRMDNACWLFHIYPLNIFFYTNDTKKHPILRFVWHIIDTFNLHTFCTTIYIIKKERPDEVHTHNLKGIGLLIPLAIRLMRVPWTHTVHDIQLITPSGLMLIGEENHWQHTGFLTRAYRVICRALFGSPTKVIFLSNWCKDQYETYGFFPRSQKIVQRLVADSVFYCHPEEERRGIPSTQHGISPSGRNDTKKIIYAGQLEPHKGIMWLLEQAVRTPHYEFHLYGGGSLLPYARLVADQHQHIHLHGAVSKQELATALKQSAYFIYPSLTYENCPLAILEAQAAGCTIIAPGQGGIGELLTRTDIVLNIKINLTSQI